MQEFNMHTNHQAASRDVTNKFAILEQLRLVADGGWLVCQITYCDSIIYTNLLYPSMPACKNCFSSKQYGRGFQSMLKVPQVRRFLFGESELSGKAIYQPGALRKKGYNTEFISSIYCKLFKL